MYYAGFWALMVITTDPQVKGYNHPSVIAILETKEHCIKIASGLATAGTWRNVCTKVGVGTTKDDFEFK